MSKSENVQLVSNKVARKSIVDSANAIPNTGLGDPSISTF